MVEHEANWDEVIRLLGLARDYLELARKHLADTEEQANIASKKLDVASEAKRSLQQ